MHSNLGPSGLSTMRLAPLALSTLFLVSCASTSQTAPVLERSPTPTEAAPTPQAVQMVSQMQALQQEMMQLRNAIEQQQFEMENLSRRQQDLYQGLEQRLRTMEAVQQPGSYASQTGTGLVPAAPNTQAPGAASMPTQGMVTSIPAQTSGATITPGVPATAPATAPAASAASDQTSLPSTVSVAAPDSGSAPAASGTVTLDQQALYDKGFELLKQSRYSDAIGSFSQLVAEHPNSSLADDAMYWVGEANYVNRQYEAAISSFRKVVTQYPASDRVPEALLKVGYVQYEIGDYAKAKQTFTDVTTRYANHPVAVSAKSRLQRIDRGLQN